MPSFGGIGKAIGGAFKGAGKNMKSAFTGQGGGINAGPSGGFMSRFKQAAPMALNNAAQMWGGDMKGAARMTGGMMRRPQAPMDNTGVAGPQGGGINTGPSPMSGIMPGAASIASGLFGGRQGIQAPGGFRPQMGGNTGFTGGFWNPNAPKLDPTTGQYTIPQSPFGDGGSIFSRIYGNMGGEQMPNRPQIYF